ncbi:MAG: hypothetical protein IM541_08780, partial [Chitinophagaceae bacterium]|nr:hypothetical protein [Chitinophagaceae bacterium]
MDVRMRKMLFAGCLLVLSCLQAEAQTMKVVADKIVGQVGDKIILKSDIVNAIADMKRQAQGQEIQLPSECQVLE